MKKCDILSIAFTGFQAKKGLPKAVGVSIFAIFNVSSSN
jgi:hypothetical protein